METNFRKCLLLCFHWSHRLAEPLRNLSKPFLCNSNEASGPDVTFRYRQVGGIFSWMVTQVRRLLLSYQAVVHHCAWDMNVLCCFRILIAYCSWNEKVMFRALQSFVLPCFLKKGMSFAISAIHRRRVTAFKHQGNYSVLNGGRRK